ncbi:MAG: hypothetical protein BGO19_01235 [Acinetobacter sp. 38-8]|nr:MAG: hypothetical protein BGO19_01235 [Acinetobacter sp. 38-8]
MDLSRREVLVLKMRSDFENWLKRQNQYMVLKFQHGLDVLKYSPIEGYQIPAVDLAFKLWKELSLCREENKTLLRKFNISCSTPTTLLEEKYHG